MLAALAPFGIFGAIPVAVVLAALGVVLIVYGSYEEWVKPRFRVDARLTDWFLRRGWSVRMERRSQFDFVLHLTGGDSGKNVVITRTKDTRDDVLAFTGRVGLDPLWIPHLHAMSEIRKRILIQEITVFLATKNIAFALNDPRVDGSSILWPPDVKVQTALAQDHTLSQHSVDLAAKSIEHSIIGVRAILRKASLEQSDDADTASRPPPTPASVPDTVPPELRENP